MHVRSRCVNRKTASIRWTPEVHVDSWFGLKTGNASGTGIPHHLVKLVILLLITVSAPTTVALGSTFSANDVEFWVGAGTNQSVLVVDWNGSSSSDVSLAWGYRWSNPATTEDMLLAVLAADPRMYAKISPSQASGVALYGVGYDQNANGSFGLSDSTSFDSSGVSMTATPSYPVATTSESADWYAEGWEDGFWNFASADDNPFHSGSWATALVGISNRVLSDGSWDSLAFDANFSFDDYAANPAPALAPLVAACNFNLDQACNPVDINLLYDNPLGEAPLDPAMDLDNSGLVDLVDLNQWLDLAATINGFSSPYQAGDTQLDHRVDLSDYNTLASHFEPAGSGGILLDWAQGNFDGNDRIDLSDYNQLAQNFSPGGYYPEVNSSRFSIHSGRPNHSHSAFVPEPNGFWLLLFGGLFGFRWNRTLHSSESH